MIDLGARPIVAFYAKMVVALESKLRLSIARFKQSLGKGYARRDSASVHLRHSQ